MSAHEQASTSDGHAARVLAVQRARRAAPSRAAAVRTLRAMNEHQIGNAAVAKNLTLLEHGAATAVTGQQLGLFLGPLLAFYKAFAAVRYAEILSIESGEPVVPVFWLQSEDHDVDEIRSVTTVRADGSLARIEIAGAFDARTPVGEQQLGPGVAEALDSLARALDGLPEAEAVLSACRDAYRPDRSFSAAFAALLARWFGEEGLLVLDPRSPTLVPLVAPIYRHALGAAAEIEDALRAAAPANAERQVQLRPGSPLFFYQPERPGPRYRLERTGSALRFIGRDGALPLEALESELEAHPERFSSSALLRPIVQDSLLPVAAYVGGPAEVRYLAEAAPLYPIFGLERPLVLERPHVLVLEPKSRKLAEQSGLDPAQLPLDPRPVVATLREALINGGAPADSLERSVLALLDDALVPLTSELRSVDGDAEATIARARDKIDRAVSGLKDRLLHARTTSNETALGRLDKLAALICPDGELQERVHSAPAYLARHGARFKEHLRAAISSIDDRTIRIDL